MRPGLLFRDRDLDLSSAPFADAAMIADLGLERVYAAMARGDGLIDNVARRVVPAALQAADEIRYRQAILADCLANPVVVRALYRLAGDAIDAERGIWGAGMRNPELVLSRGLEVLEVLLSVLVELRRLVHGSGASFSSPGFAAFFAHVETDVDDAFIATARGHVATLRGRTVHVSARLGAGNRGTGYVLHRPRAAAQRWRSKVGRDAGRIGLLKVLLSDQNAMNTLAEVRSLAIAPAAAALTESAGHILAFFRLLRAELGFYTGCLNLGEALGEAGAVVCVPEPVQDGGVALAFRGLRDPGLCLAAAGQVVGSDVDTDGRPLVVVTGANGGGKSTLLRAVGLAQLMLQAGMFVTADAFRADLRSGVLTHFTREEDAARQRGKLDEELARLSQLVDVATPRSLVLLNESFGSTNEREAAELASEVVAALVDTGVRVWFVTHLHQYAASLHLDAGSPALFLRPELGPGGERTFRIAEAAPESGSRGTDVNARVFGEPVSIPLRPRSR